MTSETEDARVGRQYSYTTVAKDAALIVGVGIVLAAVHIIFPESVKAALAFNHAEFNIWGVYTSALVHNSASHVAGNIVGYLLAATHSYWLFLEVNARQRFRQAFLALLITLPPIVMLTSYLVFQMQISTPVPPERGFSGVAAGFGGLLLVALVVYLRRHYNSAFGNSVGITVFLLLLVQIDFIYSTGLDLRVVGLTVIGVFLIWSNYIRETNLTLRFPETSRQVLETAVMSILAVAILSSLMFGMFPTEVVDGGSTTNIIGHAAGFLGGSLISVVICIKPTLGS